MVEVKITRLEYAHQLDALSGFPVERNGRGMEELVDESLKGRDIHHEIPRLDER